MIQIGLSLGWCGLKLLKGAEDFLIHLRVNVFLVVRVNRSILKECRGAMEVIVNALHKFACNRFQKYFANLHVKNCSVVLSRCRFVVLAFVVLVSFVLQMGFDMGFFSFYKNILVTLNSVARLSFSPMETLA